jgi:glycosyltransferase involved in cell wall biosynthesis
VKKKLVIGITAPQSEYLLRGQLEYFSSYYNVFLIAPQAERITTLCSKEGATHLPISIKREISILSDVVTLFSLVKIFIKLKPDIVNLGTPKVSLLGMIAAKLTGVPLRFYTCRGFRYEHETGFTRKLLMYFERLISSFSHNVICISKSVQEIGLRDNIFANNSVVLGLGSSNGVDLKLFNPTNISANEKSALKISLKLNNEFVIGYVGRLVDRKGIRELYEAFDLIYTKDSNLRLVMVGRTYSDQISNWDVIEKYNSHPGIIMTGLQPLEKIPLFLSLFNFFVLPAYWEGFGNVLIQASAMGLPILSTNVTGCKDAVKDGYSGMLVEPYSVMKLKEGMEEFISNSDDIQQYGINGIQWAKNFEPKLLWKRMQDLYDNPEFRR